MENQRSVPFHSGVLKDLVLVALAFFLMALVPYASALILVFIPLPIIFLYAKYGREKGIPIAVLSLLMVLLALKGIENGHTAIVMGFLALSGIILAEVLKRNYSIDKTVCIAAASVFLIGILLVLFQGFRLGAAPWNLIALYVEKKMQYSIDLYATLNVASEQVAIIKENLSEIVTLMTRIFPALFLVGLIFMVWINVLASRLFLKKFSLPFPDFGDLSSWKAPDKMVWYLIAAGIMMLIPDERAQYAGANMLIVILFCYLLAGIAIISFFLKKSRIPLVFKYLIYFLIAVQQILTMIVIAAGLFDLWADFRKLNKPLEEDTV